MLVTSAARSQGDILEAELSKELENGRLFRLLAKLGFINERPEYGSLSLCLYAYKQLLFALNLLPHAH